MSKFGFFVFFMICVGPFYLGFLYNYSYKHMFAGDAPPLKSDLQAIEGKLDMYVGQRKNPKFRITDGATGKIFGGQLYDYSYPDYKDHGKTVRALVARDRIFQIEENDTIKLRYESTIQRGLQYKRWSKVLFVVGIVLNCLYGIYYFKFRE